MPISNKVEPYAALSEVYQAAGFAEYSKNLGPQIINLAFDLDWSGRSLLDLGCGTGDAAIWFSGRGIRVTGVDNSLPMLRKGMAAVENKGLEVRFLQGDIRTYSSEIGYDMVVCLGSSVNYAPTLRDLESIFRMAHHALEPQKLFIFDLRTIQGLAADGSGDRVVSDNPEDHMVISRNSFNYETLTLTAQYTIYRAAGVAWERADETHLLRGYPLQGVTRALTQSKFKVLRVLTSNFEPLEGRHDIEQAIIVAQREE